MPIFVIFKPQKVPFLKENPNKKNVFCSSFTPGIHFWGQKSLLSNFFLSQ
jgi:hypothetical protein